jgi:S1-C subfamily serine protease
MSDLDEAGAVTLDGTASGPAVAVMPPPPPPPPPAAPTTPVEPPTFVDAGRTTIETDRNAGRRRRGRLGGAIAATALLSSALTAGAVHLLDGDDDHVVPAAAAPRDDAASAPTSGPLGVADIVASATPGVVAIRTQTVGTGIFNQPITAEGAGTGFVASADGLIYTNAHVVADASEVEVTLADGTTKKGSVIGVDRTDDLAVVKVDAKGLHPLPIGKSADLRVGDAVVAVGNALALPGGPTATSGIVSALNRTIDTNNGEHLARLIQTDAAINPGNSGGPLLNDRGEVVGINTAGATQAENVGFSIALDRAAPILDELAQGKPHLRAFLGVQTETVDETSADQLGVDVHQGAYVAGVTADSAADVAGIEVGDVITKMDDITIVGSPDVATAMGNHVPGDTVTITVHRGSADKELTVKLGSHQA